MKKQIEHTRINKILSILLTIMFLFLVFPFSESVSASVMQDDKSKTLRYEDLSKDVVEKISKEEFEKLPVAIKQGLLSVGLVSELPLNEKVNTEISPLMITESAYISGYNSFRQYVDLNFKQGGSSSYESQTCVPIAVANILSYYKYRGFTNIISGSILTQSEFDQICVDTKWTATGTTISNGINGYITYVGRKGYRGSSVPILNYITNIRNAVNGNMPMFATEYSSTGNHVYTVVGYKVDGGVEYLYTYTGLSIIPIAWIPRSSVTELIGIICLK